MAGHSAYKNKKYRKDRQDNKKAKTIFRMLRSVSVAVQGGQSTDPKLNPSLRLAILAAKSANVPKDRIELAIQKASKKDAETLAEIMYEGFGISGIGVIVDTVTDKPSRTLFEIRNIFKDHDGCLGISGSVTHMFSNLGLIIYPGNIKAEDTMIELALDAGAEDCKLVDNEYEIICKFENLHSTKEFLESSIGEALIAKAIWKPNNIIKLDNEKTTKVLKMLDMLEDHCDVQNVWSNLEIPNNFDVNSA